MDENQIKQHIERVLDKDSRHREHTVTARRCSSDRFDGVEFVIEGDWIPADLVLEVIRQYDKLFAESVGVAPDGEGARLVLFVVETSINPSGHATYAEMELGDDV